MIRVAVVDDQALVRAGFEVLLDAAEDLEVVGSAANGLEAVELVTRTRPDVVLMDIRMPVMDGLEATRRILGDLTCAGVRVLVLTTYDLDDYIFAALRAGASGFLVKDTPPADLLAGIRIIAAGEALLSPGITRHLIEAFFARDRFDGHAELEQLAPLTEREREVLVQLAKGLSNPEIAQTLHVSPATVKTHIARILTKVNARDRAQLIVYAYETGLVRPGRH